MFCSFKRILMVMSAVLLGLAAVMLGQQVIQTQPHDTVEGIQVDLTSIDIQNNVVTIKFMMRNTGAERGSVKMEFKDCYIMDEANHKKYFALKDSDGQFIAGPVYDHADGGRFWFDIDKGKSKGLWIKFPQPTDNPASITVSVPQVSPFENVKMTK